MPTKEQQVAIEEHLIAGQLFTADQHGSQLRERWEEFVEQRNLTCNCISIVGWMIREAFALGELDHELHHLQPTSDPGAVSQGPRREIWRHSSGLRPPIPATRQLPHQNEVRPGDRDHEESP